MQHIGQPVGTFKALNNVATDVKIDMNKLFLEQTNLNLLTHSLYSTYKQNGGRIIPSKFAELIKILSLKFAKTNKLNLFRMAEADTVQFNDHAETLRAINSEFIKTVYRFFKWNKYDPNCDPIEVGPSDARELKLPREIEPQDFQTLDVWREQMVHTANKMYRYGNKIPIWRIGIQTRHYDRSNEGLEFNDPDRASLETPIYGYDMTGINRKLGNYTSSDWYGM